MKKKQIVSSIHLLKVSVVNVSNVNLQNFHSKKRQPFSCPSETQQNYVTIKGGQ